MLRYSKIARTSRHLVASSRGPLNALAAPRAAPDFSSLVIISPFLLHPVIYRYAHVSLITGGPGTVHRCSPVAHASLRATVSATNNLKTDRDPSDGPTRGDVYFTQGDTKRRGVRDARIACSRIREEPGGTPFLEANDDFRLVSLSWKSLLLFRHSRRDSVRYRLESCDPHGTRCQCSTTRCTLRCSRVATCRVEMYQRLNG